MYSREEMQKQLLVSDMQQALIENQQKLIETLTKQIIVKDQIIEVHKKLDKITMEHLVKVHECSIADNLCSEA
jgi:hypothetical protein